MSLLIVLLGAGLVIAGIIGLRLPAFLALIGAALVVAALTPIDARTRSAARPQAAEVVFCDGSSGELRVTASSAKSLAVGDVIVLRAAGGDTAAGTVTGSGNGWNFRG